MDLRPVLRRRRAAELTLDPLVDVLAEFAGAISDALGKDYNLDNSRAERHLRDYASRRIDMINATTREALHKALASDDPRAAVQKVFRYAKEVRAKMIAQSEVDRTSAWATIDAGKWVGALQLKQWISQRDSKVRHTHTVLDGQIVGWNEDFVSPSGDKGPHPGAFSTLEENVQCRCFIAPTNRKVRRELAEGLSLQEAANDLRDPFVERLEASWGQVFEEQEKVVLESIDVEP